MKTGLSLRSCILLPLLCLATTFCSSHETDSTDLSVEFAESIEAHLPNPRESPIIRNLPIRDLSLQDLSIGNLSIVRGTVAGYLPGTSTVTPTGEFTYELPLDVPSGRSGTQPTLALIYGSRAKVAWAVWAGV